MLGLRLYSVLSCNRLMYFLAFQVPAFESNDGKLLTESNAIAYYGKITDF